MNTGQFTCTAVSGGPQRAAVYLAQLFCERGDIRPFAGARADVVSKSPEHRVVTILRPRAYFTANFKASKQRAKLADALASLSEYLGTGDLAVGKGSTGGLV
jgi:hypothetical protein